MAYSLKRFSVIAVVLAAAVLVTGCTGGLPATSWPGISASHSTVYASTGTHVMAIGAEEGAPVRWSFPPADGPKGETFYAPPVANGERVYVGSFSDKVYALDVETGTQSWQAPFATRGAVVGGTTVVSDTVYFGADDRRVYAVDTKSGAEKWHFDMRNWGWSPPVFDGGKLYVGSMDHYVYKLNATTGQKEAEFQAGGAVAGSPVVVGDRIYFGDFDRKVHALNAGDLTTVWSFTTRHWVWGSPAVMTDTLYAADLAGYVYALRLDNGQKLWEVPAGSPIRGNVIAQDGLILVATEKGEVVALNATTGKEKWRKVSEDAAKSGGFLASPTTDKGTVYVISATGHIYGYDVATGDAKWTYSPPQS